MEKYKFVGLDVHKETIAVAVGEPDGGEEYLRFGHLDEHPLVIR